MDLLTIDDRLTEVITINFSKQVAIVIKGSIISIFPRAVILIFKRLASICSAMLCAYYMIYWCH